MQQQVKILIKFLFSLLAIVFIGAGSIYASAFPEVKKEQLFSSEKLATANPFSVAVKDPIQENPDLSNNLFFKSPSIVPDDLNFRGADPKDAEAFSFRRDLRRSLQIQLFPQHFFL